MLTKILPTELVELIKDSFNIKELYEIRIRRNLPIVVNVGGRFLELKNSRNGKIIYSDKKLIDYIILRATESSLYCYNNQIKNGYIAVGGGVRIGLSGEVVLTDIGEVKTIKNIQSLVIRVPHQILNCAKPLERFIFSNSRVNNLLIISPPGCGKTTLIRDIARVVASSKRIYNCLVVDERYEISATSSGESGLDVGQFTDCLSGGNKEFAFSSGIRSLSPNVIITDELMDKKDCSACNFAINSGVSCIASIHGESILDVKRKPFTKELFENNVFDYYVVLSSKNGAGTIDGVFDKYLKPVW